MAPPATVTAPETRTSSGTSRACCEPEDTFALALAPTSASGMTSASAGSANIGEAGASSACGATSSCAAATSSDAAAGACSSSAATGDPRSSVPDDACSSATTGEGDPCSSAPSGTGVGAAASPLPPSAAVSCTGGATSTTSGISGCASVTGAMPASSSTSAGWGVYSMNCDSANLFSVLSKRDRSFKALFFFEFSSISATVGVATAGPFAPRPKKVMRATRCLLPKLARSPSSCWRGASLFPEDDVRSTLLPPPPLATRSGFFARLNLPLHGAAAPGVLVRLAPHKPSRSAPLARAFTALVAIVDPLL
mmetsp:Transcript_7740/g.19872  ORF Transcript_7740/g.19872 Transcript_7740/m.19872 type:complete len:309 (-) Transcript_7740:17-943(-)